MGICVKDKAGNRVRVAGLGLPGPAGKSAYQYAVDGGYTGTEEEFSDLIGSLDRQLHNPNLLDNWYFVKPINQKGASGTISTPGCFIDRWKLVSGSVTITSNGLVLNGTIVQLREYSVGFPTTASVLTANGILSAEYDDESKVFSITASGQTLIAAKLELGSVQTLAHKEGDTWVLNDPPPDRWLELLKCQSYQLYGHLTGMRYFWSSQAQYMFLPTPATMRGTPTIVGTPLVYSMEGNYGIQGTTVSVVAVQKNGVVLSVTGATVPVYIFFPAGCGLDSNL